MSHVAVILPVYGRHAQTLEVAALMRATAGYAAQWIAVGGVGQDAILDDLHRAGWTIGHDADQRLTYWRALDFGATIACHDLVACVANDVWAQREWLDSAVATYKQLYGDKPAMVGFGGDGHGSNHACHFLISKRLVAQFGGWPTWYDHNYGDTELCIRAQAIGRYAKSATAILEHRHPYRGSAPNDAVYAEGRARVSNDEALFKARQLRRWT